MRILTNRVSIRWLVKSDNWTGFLSYTEMPENESPAFILVLSHYPAFYHVICIP